MKLKIRFITLLILILMSGLNSHLVSDLNLNTQDLQNEHTNNSTNVPFTDEPTNPSSLLDSGNYEKFGTDNSLSLNSISQDPIDSNIWYEGQDVKVDHLSKNNTVKSLDYSYKESMNYLTQWGSSGSGNGQFTFARGIAVGVDNKVYVVDVSNNRIQVFDNDGTYLTQWGSYGSGNGQFINPLGIATDALGNVYTTEYGDRVQKFNSTGDFIMTFGSGGSGDGQFANPRGIVVDVDGNIYVSDTTNDRVQKFNSTGDFQVEWAIYGGDPEGIEIDIYGQILVCAPWGNRIEKFDSEGNYIGAIFGDMTGQADIAIDRITGDIYVADWEKDKVFILDKDAKFDNIVSWGSSGTGDGQFNEPKGIAIDNNGNIFVTEYLGNRVQKFGMARADITAVGNLPISVDNETLTVSNDRTIIGEKIYFGFTFFDLISPSAMSIAFSWNVQYSGFPTTIFNESEILTLNIDDNAVYSSDELKIDLIFTYDNLGFNSKISTFDTGLNQIVSSNVTSIVDYFSFENSIIHIDYVWTESEEINSNIRSEYRYSSGDQLLHVLHIDVFEYRIPISIYSPMSWNLTSINPNANYEWDDTNKYWYITNTVPTIYEIMFQSGSGWGVDEARESNIVGITDVSNDYLTCQGFECGGLGNSYNNDTYGYDSATLNTSIVFEGAFSVRLTDSDTDTDYFHISDSFNSGYYYLSFNFYVENYSSDLYLNYPQYPSLPTETIITSSTELNRWDNYFTYLWLDTTSYNFIRFQQNSGASGNTIFIDNMKIWKESGEQSNLGLAKSQLKSQIIYPDGYKNPAAPNLNVAWSLSDASSNIEIINESIVTDSLGYAIVTYNDNFEMSEYISKYNITSQTYNTSNYFTPVLGSDYISTQNDITFSDNTTDGLTNFDVDTTVITNNSLVVTSTGGDYWGLYDTSVNTGSYAITARIKNTDGNNTYFGITFYDIPANPISDDVILIRGGTAQTIFRVGGVETNPMFISTTDTWYLVRAEVTSTHVKFYVNDELIATRINTNPLTNPNFGVYGYDSVAQIDFIRLTSITDPTILQATTFVNMASANNTVVYSLYYDNTFVEMVDDLELYSLNLGGSAHNITYLPEYNSQISGYAFTQDYIHKAQYIYDPSELFFVHVESFTATETLASTYVTATLDGSWVAYENDTAIDTGTFSKLGTSILTTRTTSPGLVYYALKFINGSSTVWYNTTYSTGTTNSGDSYIKFQDGIGKNIPFDSFNLYYRFSGITEYGGVGVNVIHWTDITTTLNLYINDSLGNEISNSSYSFDIFITITINAHEIIYTNKVDQSLLLDIKLPSEAWSNAVGYWIPKDGYRIINLYNGTYDVRVYGSDGASLLQTTSLIANDDQSIDLTEEIDLIVYGYDWKVGDGNVTLSFGSNYGDAKVEIIDNGVSVGIFDETGVISWQIPSGVNSSQVLLSFQRNITKYSGVVEQEVIRAFSYYIQADDFSILLSDIGWFETQDQMNISFVVNQVDARIMIWHDGVLNESGSYDRVFVIDKNTIVAGDHNITMTVYWTNSTGSSFVQWYVLGYWVASYYLSSFDVLPMQSGLKLVTEVNFFSFNVYVDGVIVTPYVPDDFIERDTDEINTTLISDGRLWIRSTAYSHLLEIKDKWNTPIMSVTIDLRDFDYKVIELPIVKMYINNERSSDTEIDMYYYNATSDAYTKTQSIFLPADEPINPVWIVAGIYTIRVYDAIYETSILNSQTIAQIIQYEDRDIEGYPFIIGGDPDLPLTNLNSSNGIVESGWNQFSLWEDSWGLQGGGSGGSSTTTDELSDYEKFINSIKSNIVPIALILASLGIGFWFINNKMDKIIDGDINFSKLKKTLKPPEKIKKKDPTKIEKFSETRTTSKKVEKVSTRNQQTSVAPLTKFSKTQKNSNLNNRKFQSKNGNGQKTRSPEVRTKK